MNIKKILKKHYDFEVFEVSKLYGYDNINYLIKTKNKKYILKIYNPKPDLYDILDAENSIMLFLSNSQEIEFPEPVKNNEGKFFNEIELKNEKKIMRILTYVTGDILANCRNDENLYFSFGTAVAKMNLQLLSFRNDTIQSTKSAWDISNLNFSEKYIPYIDNIENQKLIKHFINEFNKNVIPVLPKLRKSIIHNDANDRNILVKNGQVSGIIDFGDLVYSALINELAIAVSYAISGKNELLLRASHIIKGYHKILNLKVKEIDILYYLIAARMCISVCGSAYYKTLNPENKYISINEKPAWEFLKKWYKIDPDYAKNFFRSCTDL